MMRTLRRPLLTLACCLLLVVSAAGQAPPGGPPEDVRESLATVFLFKVKQELGLSTERAMELFEILEDERKSADPLRASLHQKSRSLRAMVDSETPDEAKVKAAVDEILSLRGQLHEREMKSFDRLDTVLTPVEKGKFLLFYQAFRARMAGLRERLKEGPPGDRSEMRRRMRERFRGGP